MPRSVPRDIKALLGIGLVSSAIYRSLYSESGGLLANKELYARREDPRVVLVTCSSRGNIHDPARKAALEDEKYFQDQLTSAGILFEVRKWDDSTVDWNQYDIILIRTAWDFATSEARAYEFRRWLSRIESLCPNPTVLNNNRVLVWNMHKQYLGDLDRWEELQNKEVPIDSKKDKGMRIMTIPTIFIPANSPPSAVNLKDILSITGWKDIIIKPAIGGGSRGFMVLKTSSSKDLDPLIESGQEFIIDHITGSKIASDVVASPAKNGETSDESVRSKIASLSRPYSHYVPLYSQARGQTSDSHDGVLPNVGAEKTSIQPIQEGGQGVLDDEARETVVLSSLSSGKQQNGKKLTLSSGRSVPLPSPESVSDYAMSLANATVEAIKQGKKDGSYRSPTNTTKAEESHKRAHRRLSGDYRDKDLPFSVTNEGSSTVSPYVSSACDILIQPYLSTVNTHGELSYVGIDGEVCHSVVRRFVPDASDNNSAPKITITPCTMIPAYQALAKRVLVAAQNTVENIQPPLIPSSPAHCDTLLPQKLPDGSVIAARVDFLAVTPDVAKSIWGNMKLRICEEGVPVLDLPEPLTSFGTTWRGPDLREFINSTNDVPTGLTGSFGTKENPLPVVVLEYGAICPSLFFRSSEATGTNLKKKLADAILRRLQNIDEKLAPLRAPMVPSSFNFTDVFADYMPGIVRKVLASEGWDTTVTVTALVGGLILLRKAWMGQ